MLASESAVPGPSSGPSAPPVAAVFRDRAAPCGLEPLRRLEAMVSDKLATIRALENAPTDRFPELLDSVVGGVPSARPYRVQIVRESSRKEIQAIVQAAREGYLGPPDIPTVADRLAGAPRAARLDLASELLHGAAPDRVPLLARWVWNPARGSGALSDLGGQTPDGYAEAQVRLGVVRHELGALGFPCTTFAGVDVVLALVYAAKLQSATDERLRSGGLESLLPGAFPLATMILGVRRRTVHADR